MKDQENKMGPFSICLLLVSVILNHDNAEWESKFFFNLIQKYCQVISHVSFLVEEVTLQNSSKTKTIP